MRPPQDAVPQRRLVYELRTVIDGMMYGTMSGPIWADRLQRLLEANPHSATSTHVIHNIGPRRARFLRAYLDSGGDLETALAASFRHGKR